MDLTRRQLLGGTAVTVGAAALAACSGSDRASTPDAGGQSGSTLVTDTLPVPGTVPPPGTGGFQLFAQEDLNFQALFALGGAGVNAEVGEVVTAVNAANAVPGGASYQSTYDAMVAMGNQVEAWATESVNSGHLVSARAQFLRAAQYYNQALFFVLGTSTPNEEQTAYTTMNAAWEQAARLADPPWEKVDIPYEGSTLPAWFLKASGSSAPAPTVILNNGSDAQNIDLLAYGGQAALDRGYHALLLEGPGQGAMLFVRGIPVRPDWEHVITPVVDYLVARPDVDPLKVALTGWSFGGALVARAAAFESRLAAVVSDPGLLDPYAAIPSFLQQVAQAGDQQQVNDEWASTVIPGSTPEQTFALKKRFEIYTNEALQQVRQGQVPTDWYTISRAIQQFDVSAVVGQIKAPYLVTGYEQDTLNPGGPQQLFDALPGNKTEVSFTATEGAQFHCAPMAPERRNEVIFDWIDETFGR